jgi:hypothetical protein
MVGMLAPPVHSVEWSSMTGRHDHSGNLDGIVDELVVEAAVMSIRFGKMIQVAVAEAVQQALQLL